MFVDLFRKGEQVRALERRERERVEAGLRAAELRFSRFMEHLPGLAWIKDPDGRYLYANEAAERAFGVRRADLYGKTDAEVFPPETAAAFRENDRRAVDDPGGIQTVETLTHPDGTVHHSLVTKFPIPGPGGRPALVGGMAVDVTDRMRAQEALRASEGRYRALVEATSHAVWSSSPTGATGDFAVAERWWADLTGQSPSDRPGRWLDVVHPDDRDRAAAAWTTSLTTGARYDVEYRVRARDGGWRTSTPAGCRSRTSAGPSASGSGRSDDVTPRRAAEDAQRFLAEAGEVLGLVARLRADARGRRPAGRPPAGRLLRACT